VNLIEQFQMKIGKDKLISLLDKIVIENQQMFYLVVGYAINYQNSIDCQIESEIEVYLIHPQLTYEKVWGYRAKGRIVSFLQMGNNFIAFSVDN